MAGTRGGRGSRGTRTGATPLAPDLVVLGRYRLVDRVADNGGTSLWRGVDERLRRPGAVRFMAIDDALAVLPLAVAGQFPEAMKRLHTPKP